MEDFFNILTNNGIGAVCVFYLIYFQNTTMKDLQKSMQEIVVSLTKMNERLTDIEDKIGDTK